MLCIFVFLSFLCIGYLIWQKFKNRKVFFENILTFCNHLLVEISFQKNTIRDIINIYSGGYQKHLRTVLIKYLCLLNQKSDITRETVGAIFDPKLLRENEIAILVDFFCELGKHGSSQEKQKIESRRVTFENFFTTAADRLKRDASIYLKLFIFMGVGAVILML